MNTWLPSGEGRKASSNQRLDRPSLPPSDADGFGSSFFRCVTCENAIASSILHFLKANKTSQVTILQTMGWSAPLRVWHMDTIIGLS